MVNLPKKRKITEKKYILPKKKIIDFCKKNHIIRLGIFGSVLTKDFNVESDIDLLVDFDPKHFPGLFRVSGMELELQELLGREVDLRTPGDISPYFRKEVIDQTKMIYGQKRFNTH